MPEAQRKCQDLVSIHPEAGGRSGVHDLSRPSVLYVDDDLHVRKSFARVARRMGFNVTLASCEQEAVAAASACQYAVIVSDLCMPDVDGLVLVTNLYRLQPKASYVLVTGMGHVELPDDELLNQALCSTVHKPWDIEHLKRVLTQASELHRARSDSEKTHLEPVPSRLRVLLLEDNPGDADLTIELLAEQSNARVKRAVRLRDAMEYLRWEQFDLILADLSLPDARGLDTVTSLQSAAAETPIVVLSGLDDRSLAGQAVQLGAQDYLVKNKFDGERLARSLTYARERKRAERRLSSLARMDAVTGLANRNSFLEQLEQLLQHTRATRGRCYVMYIDLDGFKLINDRYGHDAGDFVLRKFAQRVKAVVRDCDVVARLGGDEFVVAGGELSGAEAALAIAQRILRSVARPMEATPTLELAVTTSVGIAVFPDVAGSRDSLLSAADAAMYAAKRTGGNAARFADLCAAK